MIPMLEVMIGVFFIFSVSSLTCSAAAELLEGLLKNRAKDLERGIIALVGSREIGRDLLAHPLIRSLAKQEGQGPTHLPSRTFAIALLDLVARGSYLGLGSKAPPPDLGARLKELGKKILGIFISFPPVLSAPKGDDRYQTVMNALTGPVDDLLEKIPDSALKRSLTGLFAVAKGLAQPEAGAPRPGTLPGVAAPASGPAVLAPAAPAGTSMTSMAARSPGMAVSTPAAPNTAVLPGAGVSNQLALGEAGPAFTAAQALGAIEKWFDDGMGQVTAWYKRRSQFIIFVIGCALAAAMNLDAITITRTLATDPAVRAALIAEAEAASKADQSQQVGANERFQAARRQLATLGLPIGWSQDDPNRQVPSGVEPWALKILGLLLTALATSLGAPFWFDLLKRVMLVRAGLNPDEDSRQRRSK